MRQADIVDELRARVSNWPPPRLARLRRESKSVAVVSPAAPVVHSTGGANATCDWNPIFTEKAKIKETQEMRRMLRDLVARCNNDDYDEYADMDGLANSARSPFGPVTKL